MSVRELAPDAELQADTLAGEGRAWTAKAIDLPEANRYPLDVRLRDGGTSVAETRTRALPPDPSVYGAETIPLPESSPEAIAPRGR